MAAPCHVQVGLDLLSVGAVRAFQLAVEVLIIIGVHVLVVLVVHPPTVRSPFVFLQGVRRVSGSEEDSASDFVHYNMLDGYPCARCLVVCRTLCLDSTAKWTI